MTDEIWKDIEGYEGVYQISNFGNIRSFCIRGSHSSRCAVQSKLLKPYISKNKGGYGYYVIRLYLRGDMKRFFVHRLVALHFIEKVDGMPEVNHKDRNKLNNNASNLEWADDFIQSNNRDCVINAKQYVICFEKSKWRVRWKENNKNNNKYFFTEKEAREWAEKEMPLKTLDKLKKPKPRK